ncbi:TonB family protein [Candidatus Fermentibacterales bacterium]|nr:TonB family protein [Candidatus Fermentibacterales bacterium]
MLQLLLTPLCALSVAVDVDQAIDMYEWGDIPGAIDALESLLDSGALSLDERLRAYDRLGSAYYAMGQTGLAGEAYLSLLSLDSHYDLGPLANPRLLELLNTVRQENLAMATIRTIPEGALVTLDGELMGVSPISVEDLMGGCDYRLEVYSSGYASETMTLAAQPGQHHDLSFVLIASADSTAATLASSGLPGDEQDQASFSTTDLVNIITSSEASLDIAALADQGAFQSTRESALQLAGSERIPQAEIESMAVSSIHSASEAAGLMVFADTGSGSPTSVSSGTGSGSSRDPESVMAVLAGQQGSVTFIYNKHLRTDPLLSGTVVVQMVIEPSGRVSEVTILESNTYNPAFELELARAVQSWRFGAVDENEGALVVVRPFNFSGGY